MSTLGDIFFFQYFPPPSVPGAYFHVDTRAPLDNVTGTGFLEEIPVLPGRRERELSTEQS